MTNIETTAKYYTPELNEIHHGFEFEFCIPPMNKTDEKVWQKYNWNNRIATIEIRHNCIAIGGFCIKPENLRVKCLDKDDVESLAWLCTGRSIDLLFNKVGMFFSAPGVHKFTEYKLHFRTHDYVLKINAYFGNQDEGCLFEGIVKNKSQLKSVMNLIGITQ